MSYSYSIEKTKSMQPLGESHSHSLGRFGTGYVDLLTGNLIIQSQDFAWNGRKLPVTIQHNYNSKLYANSYTYGDTLLNAADYSRMLMGCGFHLNLLQSMKENGEKYVYTDDSGVMTEFVRNNQGKYEDENKTGIYDKDTGILRMGEVSYVFSNEKLVEIQQHISCSDGTEAILTNKFTYTNGQLVSVKDGAGRVFTLEYDAADRLSAIIAPHKATETNLTKYTIEYQYDSSNHLTQVTYPDNRCAILSYFSGLLSYVTLTDVAGNITYRVKYTYRDGRVWTVAEEAYNGSTFVLGQSTKYEYDDVQRTTTVTTTEESDDESVDTQTLITVYVFNADGSLRNRYMSAGVNGEVVTPSGSETGINPYMDDGGVSVRRSVINLLADHDFRSLAHWTECVGEDCDSLTIASKKTQAAKFGSHAAVISAPCIGGYGNGMYQTTNTLPAGDYTFSAYVLVGSKAIGATMPGAYLKVMLPNGRTLYETEHIAETGRRPMRLEAPFTLDSTQTVCVYILVDGKATVYASAAQLERGAYANKYNMLYDSDFEIESIATEGDHCWVSAMASLSTAEKRNGTYSVKLGDSGPVLKSVSQRIYPKTSKTSRETFTLTGWAKSANVVLINPAPEDSNGSGNYSSFGLAAKIKYKGVDALEIHSTEFDPNFSSWQEASLQFCKKEYREIEYIVVAAQLKYTTGIAYFDEIQLLCDSAELYLSSSDFNDDDIDDDTDDVDDVSAEDEAITQETTDAYGNNLSEMTYHHGEFGTLYRWFDYTHSGNDLACVTDSRGEKTEYTVNQETSRNTEVKDRCGNITAYEYDEEGRISCVQQKNAANTEIANVSYSYDEFDQLTEITRGDGMQYKLDYNDFHKLEAIRVNGRGSALVEYGYKNNNGRLKSVKYANGSEMIAKYNAYGQMTSETWMNGTTVEAKYQYAYNVEGNIVRSIDNLNKKEYNYYYEDGTIIRATQSTVTLTVSGIVTSKSLDFVVLYMYDDDGKLVKKTVQDANGNEYTYKFTNLEDGNPVVTLPTGAVSQSKNDKFGRKEFDELQLGTAFMSRRFSYHDGIINPQDARNGNLKSSPTTNLVKEILFHNGRTLQYEYDAEERITQVIDSVDGTTVYMYDAQGQLVKETRGNSTVNTMTYDGYGNIRTKNNVVYEYDTVWKDKLVKVGSQTISYDDQGNPTSYLGHNLTWEKGRQLKKFDNIEYTYNANGIRTSKKVNGVLHTYILDGTKILKETWGAHTLIPLYDNEDSVCGIIYDGTAYYFYKNQQGDIIEITDSSANVVARYSYDAWGVPTIQSDTSGCSLATVNPFRYREYYYDAEIGMYYLQSRYYNPIVSRFVNVDNAQAISSFGLPCVGYNIFAYCQNTPVNSSDASGQALIQVVAKIILGVILGFLIQYVLDILDYLVGLILDPKKKFSPSFRDYLISIASSILAFFDITKKWVKLSFDIIILVAPHIKKDFKNIEWHKLICDLIFYFIGEFVGGALSRKKTKKINKATQTISRNKKKLAKRLKEAKIDRSKEKIKGDFYSLGVGVTFALNITNSMVQLVAGYFI